MRFMRPHVVGINDQCDACGSTGTLGICFGARRPVICDSCLTEAARVLDRWHRKVDGSHITRVDDASARRRGRRHAEKT